MAPEGGARDNLKEELARTPANSGQRERRLVLEEQLGEAMADAAGRRKPYIFVFQFLLFAGCVALWWAYPHRPDLAQPIGWAVVAATVGAEMSIVFNNAQLPHIVSPARIGWLSGFGWGLGYVGGLISLALVLAAQAFAGLDADAHVLERLTGPASAIWLALFVLPMFLFTPDGREPRRVLLVTAAREGGRALFHTVRKPKAWPSSSWITGP